MKYIYILPRHSNVLDFILSKLHSLLLIHENYWFAVSFHCLYQVELLQCVKDVADISDVQNNRT